MTKHVSKCIRDFAVCAVAGAALLGASAAKADTLMIYEASLSTIHKAIIAAYKIKRPGLDIQSIHLSTGPITERAIAEKSNPKADVIYMVNTIALERLKKAGVLEPYKPKGMAITEQFMERDHFYHGHDASILGMAVNTKLLKEKNLPMPKVWGDLIKPIYKGNITIASPAKSGTGLAILSTMVDAFGWNYVDNLHQNIFKYNSSGKAAARQAGSGETVIGLSFDGAIMKQVESNPAVKMVIGEISPNVVEGGGLIAGGPNPKEGKLFLDWLFSEEAAKVFDPFVGIGAVPGYGKIDVSKAYLWKRRRPLDAVKFKREWVKKYEK